MITFNDIFKSNFLDNITGVSMIDMIVAIVLSFCVGLFIFFIYKKTYSGVMYSSSFGVTLIAITMITSLVILAVTSNVVLSLGMVGALSIVRFRTAIKEPLDIAFLFWSVAAGIVVAAGLLPLAVFGSFVIGIILLIFVNRKTYIRPYIAVISCENAESERRVNECLKANVKKSVLKSKSVKKGFIEMTVEIRLKNEETEFINAVSDIDGVLSAVLVSYNGEYAG